ncbi:MAG: hypothetical protein PHN69_05850 [Candidatus Pacebacteria bacterium]|nr:hypothetical protein [Candidatus Paceibacterota bacterium]
MNIQRKNALDNYYTSPNMCKECGKIIEVGNKTVTQTRKKKFCNHVCSARYNNTTRAFNKYYNNPNICYKCNKVIELNGNPPYLLKHKNYCNICYNELKNMKYTNNVSNNINICKNCGKSIAKYSKSKLCNKCSNIHNKEIIRLRYIEKWLNGEIKISYASKLGIWVRKFIYDEQDGKCSICGINNIWNNKPMIFILDHINGHRDNNMRDNLRLICSNCDSQLSTYKARNKGNGLKYR